MDNIDKAYSFLKTLSNLDLSDAGLRNTANRYSLSIVDISETIKKIKEERTNLSISLKTKTPKPEIQTFIEYDEGFKASTESNGIRYLNYLALAQKRKNIDSRYWDKIRIPSYTDKKANELTKCIIDFIQLKGGQSERINSMGRVIDKRAYSKDCFGNTKVIGSMKWIKSTGTLGTADISATIRGLSVKIEVKIKKDIQSKYQKSYQDQVQKAGGIYILASDFQGFFEWYNLKFGE